jgi:hypothetical protein
LGKQTQDKKKPTSKVQQSQLPENGNKSCET